VNKKVPTTLFCAQKPLLEGKNMTKSLPVPCVHNLVHVNLKISHKMSGNLPGKEEKKGKKLKSIRL